MPETQLLETVELDVLLVDVLFVTEQDQIPSQLISRLDEKSRQWRKISVDEFLSDVCPPDSVGTVILDTSEITPSLREDVCQTVHRFEQKNIATILLNDHIDFPFDNFRLATMLESYSFEEILGRIESSLTYRNDVGTFVETEQKDLADTELSEQLKVAGQVQRDFLPTQLPDLDRFKWSTMFRPADWVSGDIYDVARLDEEHIGFYIADAVGHSMPAALLTMFIKQAIVMRRTTGNDYEIFSPLKVVQALNARMCEQALSGCFFATVCYCLLNTTTLEMTYVRGGHPYPIFIRDGKPTQLESTGGLIGVFGDTEFEQETVQLQSGDKLLLYSDGGEDMIGGCTDQSSFEFTQQFIDLSKRSIDGIIEGLEDTADDRDLPHAEIDDVTAVGLEIL
jgi:sigma-B regulation protein RsbU (phosphoserine phosphatase)